MKCRQSKNHKREIVDFELKLRRNLCDLSRLLLSGKYDIVHYRKFNVYEPKKREIESLSYKHRVVQMALCFNILEPLLERHVIETNCACRAGKGTDYARDVLQNYIHRLSKRGKVYALKCDVSKFFASIDHEILIQKLSKVGFEDKTFDLLKKIINSTSGDRGLPIGNQTSQWFSLFYLDSVDRVVKEVLRCKCYVRYMDDFILLSNDKTYLKYCLTMIRQEVSRCHLKLNDKTQIITLSQGIAFLGYLFKIDSRGRLLRYYTQRAKCRIKKYFKCYNFLLTNNLVRLEDYIIPRLLCLDNLWSGRYAQKYLVHLTKKHLIKHL